MENICEWEKCRSVGKYRAPTKKDSIKEYKWLCEEHIKIFNKNWNYFEGMSQKEFEIFLKSDLTWHRPTQQFSSPDNFFNVLWNNALSDRFEIFNKEKIINMDELRLSKKDKDAFELLELNYLSDWNSIQKKFKTLVKKFHPDKHSGNRKYEDKLKKITIAYSHLKMIMTNRK